ncbi:MAG: hypothetical protein KIT87_26910, partial [Anaerolineae bacterium]|nr:hypothetical protein [Anaerolineae bacterium]
MDDFLFGWDDTAGIVSVWADREGRALIWKREGERLTCTQEHYRPWLFAAHLDDLAHLGRGVVWEETSPPAPLLRG